MVWDVKYSDAFTHAEKP